MKDNDFYWYWFANIPGIGLKTRKKFLEYFRHPKYVYEASDSEIKVFLTKNSGKGFRFLKTGRNQKKKFKGYRKRESFLFTENLLSMRND